MNSTKKIISLSVLFLFLFGTTISVLGQNNRYQEDIIVNFSFSNPVFERTSIKGNIYDVVKINNLPNTNDLGIPRLPVKSVRILLPQGREVKEIKVTTSNKVNLGTGYTLAAGTKLVPLMMNNKLLNNEVSSSEMIIKDFKTSVFEDKGVYICRGFNILHLNLYPVQYNTENGELSYFETMNILIKTEETTINRAFRGLDADYKTIQNIVDNPDCIQTYKKGLVGTHDFQEQYDYVVITNEDLKYANGNYTFEDLLDYKESLGLTTKIVTIEEIVSNSEYNVFGPWGDANSENPFYGSEITGNLEYFDNEPARIRNFIRFAYTEWGTRYVLLGGDADVIVEEDNIIPLRGLFANESGLPLNGLRDEEQDDIPSDVYYACLDGNFNYDCDDHFGECANRNDLEEIDEADLYSEVSVGRACVDSEEELSNFVSKTLQYATGGGDHYLKILFIGEYLGPLFYTPWGGDYKDLFEEYIPSYYTLEKLYDRDDPINDWNPFDLLVRLKDDPVQFINHDGHGIDNYILKLYAENIRSLRNKEHFFIYSHSCYTGSFDNYNPWYGYRENDCIAEILTAEIEYGAYACILNARYGLGSEDTIDSPSGALDGSFLKALFTENIKELGPANHYSKEDNVWRIDENGIRWCYYQTNLFGDPQLSIRDLNQPPIKPVIDGPTKVKVGESHDYLIYTTDPNGDSIYYHIDVDDGTGGQWFGPYKSGTAISINITFPQEGYVTIRVKAKDDFGGVGETAELKIQVPRTRIFRNNNIQYIFELISRLKSIFFPHNFF